MIGISIADQRINLVFVVKCTPICQFLVFVKIVGKIGLKFLNNQMLQGMTIKVCARLERKSAMPTNASRP